MTSVRKIIRRPPAIANAAAVDPTEAKLTQPSDQSADKPADKLVSRPRRWFCHYFDNGHQKWSEASGLRIAKEAAALKMGDGSACFDEVLTFRKRDLGEEWIKARAEHFKHECGAGYWVWKPRVIQLAMAKMAEGDILMYADSGCEFKGSIEPLLKMLDAQDTVPFELDIHYEYQWTKGDAFESWKAHAFRNTKQRIGGIHLHRKSPKSLAVINEWAHWCDRLSDIDDTVSRYPSYPGFRDHRHDQSAWSLVTKKHNVRAFPDVSWPPDKATVISASRKI